MTTPPPRTGPLTDLRVIELGQLIAGPFCGQIFADFGADVIKVEPPGQGDPLREWGREGFPLWWSVVARGKRCITANLRETEGQDIVRRLVADADFLLENFRPGTLEKWGLGYEALKAINPRLIMIRVSGYGQTGPYASRAGYASVGEALGGLRYVMGEADRVPSRAGISLGDSLAGLHAALGALAALHHREKTGEGQMIDATIYESVLSVMEGLVPEYQFEGYTRERSGSVLPNIAPSNIYEGSDGMVIIAANQDTVFARLCTAIGQPGLKDAPDYKTHIARGQNQAALDDLIQAWAATRSIDEIERTMIANGVPVGKVYRAADMLEDPHYAARHSLVDVPSDLWPGLKQQNVFPKLSATPGRVRWAGSGQIGSHTEEVLTELLNLTPGQVAKLRASGIV
ncbi:MAG: CoA transferase [Hyphomonas sp.]|uniref:CaiB/BaiF CoA transferase family protein n=1 Tax=Hyphomonas sp. TaxID=87 RepID=UPI0017C49987|nr:CaiB/BaiF CoA-transferase family protein [Hyphomonas sp.]MBU3919111.1 CoA transferase [Alphaproteobacteria bacterium]MBA3067245.1 CoA transferase [Hyphomonas sp.]MBU4061145.1 CoA transferase [Alphaproteobacteria bacterium]MBU4165057.1 CoA transferase [Alphaproteobacteria bacterium]MBU4569553.1 CoA transferase [Alphaproteobacteria bacterium]